MNADMTLEGFKTIYWWEWSHRLLARVLGAVFVLPALAFWATGRLRGALGARVALATALLALEPIVGWWMVASGLSERTEVAQDRLALHLLIAAAVFATLIYAAVGMDERMTRPGARRFVTAAHVFAGPGFRPTRPRRAGGGPARGPRLQHLAADGRPMDSERAVPAATGDPLGDGRRDDGAIRSSDDRLCRRRLRAGAGVRGARFRRRLGAARRDTRRRRAAASRARDCHAGLGRAASGGAAHQAFALILFGLAAAHASATRQEAA